jgi:2-dehydro-3-deoxygluconokinase
VSSKLSALSIGEAMVEFFRDDAGHWHQGFAGDTLNMAWGLRALLPGSARVDYFSRAGTDPFSQRFRGFLEESGIGTSHVGTDPERGIGLYTIETDDAGERSFSYWRSASAARRYADDIEGLIAACEEAGLVYLSGISLAILEEEACAAFLEAVDERGSRAFKLAFDPNIRPKLWQDASRIAPVIEEMAAKADILLPTHDDEAAAFGDKDAAATRARYAALGVPEIVAKDGTRPAQVFAGGAELSFDVPEAVRPLDTTGAGDSFNAAYLATRLKGGTVEQAVRIAQKVSALTVQRRGALVPMDQIRDAAGD